MLLLYASGFCVDSTIVSIAYDFQEYTIVGGGAKATPKLGLIWCNRVARIRLEHNIMWCGFELVN